MMYAVAGVFAGSLGVLARARSAETRYYAALIGITAAMASCLFWGPR
ncbi:hypothetical protein [Streptomyces cylindrosporus]|uniref:Uncharacterized protein n=1 Tax=Streptomyces cylindrosporus TaxID=2927583 RepID=A0ABS9YK41_9ACTN|nr:hypothetical protein [Streptomyces cylindrosporus]MCI3277622.1 hypothetical protein [Streptomyces cylindrosporus]